MRALPPHHTCISQYIQSARALILVGLLPLVLLAACSGGREEAAPVEISLPATPRLSSMENFRDLAGADAATVYRTTDGRALWRGVYELRTPGEIAKAPDRVPQGAAFADALAPLMGVQERFLRAGLDEVRERYGSMDGDLREGLGLDEQVLDALRNQLLE